MIQQNYANHSRYVKGYHFILSAFLLFGTVASFINAWLQWIAHDNFLSALLVALLFICSVFIFLFVRQFPMKAQDRAIRVEENLRYFILTRKPLDSRITMSQIIALRFAQDDEFITLVDKALHESMSADEIKRAIKNWRADNFRM
ncbi:hypothetical protein JN11_03790 [Mucilaginibacter frigoritolerans]|uniref:Uncharacterized protein n=1 Tax=Mucilaginibacter frigoritolerans TaxID=652788 RepID=A0A562TTW1_9SPHI|nr:DUF6526 family protein [Mucilaginibacter frigoritolerans]TWI96678.1 hypothetical protein JN11_03790 [Mucilaginibacter frigoritolerans]